jgi:hypothetical protein
VTHFNDREHVFFPCVHTIWSRSIVHVNYTWFVSMTLLFPTVGVFYYFGRSLRQHYRSADPSEQYDSSLDELCQYLVDEVRLILLYVSVGCVFTWLMTNDPIDCVKICRWIIEASYIPFMFFRSLVLVYHDA